MRIPLNKVYRAFPQLDRFSDEECEQFVRRAEQDYPGSKIGARMTGAAAIIAAMITLGVLEKFVWAQFRGNLGSLARAQALDAIVILTAVFMVLFFCLGMLWVRDRWLIRTITLRVHQTSCPGCGYSLLGLAVSQGVVTCPECAAPYFLEDHGMTVADFMAERARG